MNGGAGGIYGSRAPSRCSSISATQSFDMRVYGRIGPSGAATLGRPQAKPKLDNKYVLDYLLQILVYYLLLLIIFLRNFYCKFDYFLKIIETEIIVYTCFTFPNIRKCLILRYLF